MKTLLITGGAGFIGSNFIRYMIKKYREYSIINLDLLTYAGKLENLQEVDQNDRYTFVQGDIADVVLVDKLFNKYDFDYVVNFAAESHVDNSIKNPGLFVRTNVLGTQVLLDAAKNKWSIGLDQFGYPVYRKGVKYLQISTDEVYGSLGDREGFTENSPLLPNNPYSASKASADLLVRAYSKTYKLPTNITRCSNNYGPNQDAEKLIPLMITKAINDEILPIYGDGMQIRDWLHVQDHCQGIDKVLHLGKDMAIYNIGGNREMTNIRIVEMLLKELNKSKELIVHVQDRLGHDQRYAIDSTKIRDELGWEPIYSFEQGIKETIEWYKK